MAIGDNLVIGNSLYGSSSGWKNLTLFALIPGSAVVKVATNNLWKIVIAFAGSTFAQTPTGSIGAVKMYRCALNDPTVIVSASVSFGGDFSPDVNCPVGTSTSNPFLMTSDVVNLNLNPLWDYWLAVYFANISGPPMENNYLMVSNCPRSLLPGFSVGGNQTGVTVIPVPGGWGTGAAGYLLSQVIAI